MAVESDLPEPRVRPVPSKNWPRITVRTTRALHTSRDWFLETGFDACGAARDRVLNVADLVVEDIGGGGLQVQSVDNRLKMDLLEFFGDTLGQVVVDSMTRPLPTAAHTPRITIDHLVMCREAWTFVIANLPFEPGMGDSEVFVQARRFRRTNDLPRFVFVKADIEDKPFYVDFESPALISSFARVVRRAKQRPEAARGSLIVSEMLPKPDEVWLPDAAGNRYTSELRLVAVDQSSASAAGAAR